MPDKKTERRVRTGGRAARVAARTTPGAESHNPAPSGLPGGQYKPLTEKQCATIHSAALTLLETVGMGEVPQIVQELARKRGCRVDETGRTYFTRDYVEQIIADSPKAITLFGQEPVHDITIKGEDVRFGTGGAAVQTLDIDTGAYRASTLCDLYDFARMADNLDNICWFTRCCVATDVPDILDLDINTAYACALGTTKPIGSSFTFGSHVDQTVEMFDMILGARGAFIKRPFCKAHISPIISPMRYGEDAVDVLEAALRHNMPINVITAAQAGATAPAPLAGMLAQSFAETLASLVLVDLFRPGHPIIFSNWPFVVDLRTGSFAGGSPEMAILNACSAQLSNRLGLISGVASSMTDSKVPDIQAGYEKGLTALAAALSGGNLIYESAATETCAIFLSDESMKSCILGISS